MFNKMSGTTPDLTESNVEKLKQLFPEIITDGKIDFEKLEILLGKEIDDTPERYNFTWHGKKETMQFAQQPSNGTLRPIKEKSKNWDTTENLYIEGDNLEVLKLLQKSYNNKVKMIYIDPPYNTGNDFIYKDDFKDSVDSYLEMTGQKNHDGIKFNSNTESNGRYHTDWLNMMYSRLKLSRNLLCDDGVIFISIDDNEFYNLKKICDELFGEKNYITTFAWEKKKKPSFLNKNVGTKYEYIIAYAKNRNLTHAFSVETTTIGKKYPFNNAGNSLQTLIFPPKTIKFPKITDRLVQAQDMSSGNIKTFLENDFNIVEGTNVEEVRLLGEWRYSQSKLNELIKSEAEITISSIPFRPNLTKDGGEVKKMHNLLTLDHYNVGTNEDATDELFKLLGNNYFDYAKPTSLIKLLIKSITYTDKDAIILDFFSGSSTTAESVFQQNMEDSGTRRFIMVQLPETLGEETAAYQDGYYTICDIGEERIRRAGEKAKRDLIEKNSKEGMLIENQMNPDKLDIGFKVLSLDTSNLKEWQAEFDDIEVNIDLLENNFVDGRSEEDVLYEIILKNGLDLTYPINKILNDGVMIYDVAFGNLFVCLNDKINRNVAHKIATLREEYDIETSQVVFKDSGFESDTEKLNCYEILKAAGYQEADLLSI